MPLSKLPLVLIAMLLLASAAAAAHAPQFSSENNSLETAREIEDTVKSWVIYGHLEPGEALYYTFEIEEGDRLLLNLIIPVEDGDGGFLPRMALMVPGAEAHSPLPSWVDVPEGYGVEVIDTDLPDEATYEGFTPSAFYDLGRTDAPAEVTGRYYLAIFAPPPQEGNFALVVGYGESFTLQELVFMPFSLFNIYLWQGQEAWQALAPMIATLVLGTAALAYYRRRREEPIDLQHLLLLAGGLLILGTAASTLTQTLVAVRDSYLDSHVLISVLLFVLPGALGFLTLLRGWRPGPLDRGGRARVAVVGLLSVFVWAGYLIGPALLLISAALPQRLAGWPRR